MSGIPVTIMLDRNTFTVLERLAAKHDKTMREYVADHLARSVIRYQVGSQRKQQSQINARGTKYRAITDDDVAEIAALTQNGWTADEIARRLGCSHRTIQNWRRRIREGQA